MLGVFADERRHIVGVCVGKWRTRRRAGGRGNRAEGVQPEGRIVKASYAFPGSGLCNDIAVAKDGTVYATDTTGARVLRLKKGATALDVWAADPRCSPRPTASRCSPTARCT